MNAGKLVAEIAVLAIVAYCCYGAVAAAIPDDADALSNPVSGLDSMQMSASQNGLNLNVTITGDLTNNLPQDLVDVGVTMYLGSGVEKLKLASVTKTLPAKSTVHLDEPLTIPVYAVMAYTTNITEVDGAMTLPLCTKISFKYFEWQDSYLVDMSMTIKTDMKIDGLGAPTISYPNPGDKTTVQVTMDTTSGIIHDVISGLNSEYKNTDIELVCGAAKIVFNTDGDNIKFTVAGDGTNTAVQILENALETDGKLSFTYSGESYELDKEQAETLLEVFNSMYGKVTA